MPSFNLTAGSGAGSVTDGVPVGAGTFTANVSGTFVGTVLFERAVTPGASYFPIARDNSGNFLQFTAPSGDLPGQGSTQEPDALIRARMSAYTSGTAVVRIGR
jgi:hypothetical protein